MNRQLVHFHDGPRHGDTDTLDQHVEELIVVQHGVPIGAYVRDPLSAGGQCMDWHPEYEFAQITPPPPHTPPPPRNE